MSNRKRNVSYLKPEDPAFLKVLKRQAGYDDRNHKFDDLMNAEDNFVGDGDNEQPQVVVLKEGDLTADEAELERKKIEQKDAETKADLNQRIIYKPKDKKSVEPTKRKTEFKLSRKNNSNEKKGRQLLSFNDDEEEESYENSQDPKRRQP